MSADARDVVVPSLSLKLIADPKGRADRNLRPGFLMSSFDCKDSGADGEKEGGGNSTTASTWLVLIVSPSETRTSTVRAAEAVANANGLS